VLHRKLTYLAHSFTGRTVCCTLSDDKGQADPRRPGCDCPIPAATLAGLLGEEPLAALAVVQLLDGVRHRAPANPLVAVSAEEVNAGEKELLGIGCKTREHTWSGDVNEPSGERALVRPGVCLLPGWLVTHGKMPPLPSVDDERLPEETTVRLAGAFLAGAGAAFFAGAGAAFFAGAGAAFFATGAAAFFGAAFFTGAAALAAGAAFFGAAFFEELNMVTADARADCETMTEATGAVNALDEAMRAATATKRRSAIATRFLEIRTQIDQRGQFPTATRRFLRPLYSWSAGRMTDCPFQPCQLDLTRLDLT